MVDVSLPRERFGLVWTTHPRSISKGGQSMIRRAFLALSCAAALWCAASAHPAQAQDPAFGRQWGNTYGVQDWDRFYHYPFVYYPQNFWGPEYYRSSNSLYYRYPPEMQIPVYNLQWHNMYPVGAKYHMGHQFIIDTF